MRQTAHPVTGSGAQITITRRIEWANTDAAGIYHWSTVPLLVESAETELYDTLDLAEQVYGRLPRAHFEVDYHTPLRFNDAARVHLAVTAVGRTSITYRFSIHRGDVSAAQGRLVVVNIDEAGRPAAVADDVRRRLGFAPFDAAGDGTTP